MGKITEIKLVGQPNFKQIMNLVDKVDINGLIRNHESDYYYKSFKTRTHLFTMLFGILSRCNSVTYVSEGQRAMGGKLNYHGMDQLRLRVRHVTDCLTGIISFLKICILCALLF